MNHPDAKSGAYTVGASYPLTVATRRPGLAPPASQNSSITQAERAQLIE